MDEGTVPRESFCDVLITGAGPAGCMAALALAKAGVRARLIEKRATVVQEGHADGLNVRSMEFLQSLGVADDIRKLSLPLYELTSWATVGGVLQRVVCSSIEIPNHVRDPGAALGQGDIERVLLDALQRQNGSTDERGILPTSLAVDSQACQDPHSHAVTVKVQHLREDEIEPTILRSHTADEDGTLPDESLFAGALKQDWTVPKTLEGVKDRKSTEEVIHAKYMIAAEGAHSWTRNILEIPMDGDRTDFVWGVLDIAAISDFPDLRRVCQIKSAAGTILVIPRERGLTRLYIPLVDTASAECEKLDLDNITPHFILKRAQQILHPWKLSYHYCEWWTAYHIGQRVAQRYTDPNQRIFLVGDAVHTHSPKEGLGMNTSMGDAYNLAWKIAGVVKHQLQPSVLGTYEYERRIVAQDLIALDRRISRAMSTKDPKVMSMYEANMGFMMGLAIRYYHSLIVAEPSLPFDAAHLWTRYSEAEEYIITGITEPENSQAVLKGSVKAASRLATGLPVGAILPDTKVVRHADGLPCFISDLREADGSWKLLVFAGNVADPTQMTKANRMAEKLESGLLSRYRDSFHLTLIHSAPRTQVELSSFHRLYYPLDPRRGYNFEKIYRDEQLSYADRTGLVYDKYGIDRNKGCVVALRPDRHVAFIGSLEDEVSLDEFFAGFMIPTAGLSNGHA